jgi:hypothetical protein
MQAGAFHTTAARLLTQGLSSGGWLGGVMILLLLSGCGQGGGVRFAERELGKDVAIEAIDGATVRIDGETYRLFGINAPSLPPEADCWAEALLGWEAREALASELTGRVEVDHLETDPADTVRLFVEGRSVSELMVQRGLAASSPVPWNWCAPVVARTEGAPRLRYPTDPATPRSVPARPAS